VYGASPGHSNRPFNTASKRALFKRLTIAYRIAKQLPAGRISQYMLRSPDRRCGYTSFLFFPFLKYGIKEKQVFELVTLIFSASALCAGQYGNGCSQQFFDDIENTAYTALQPEGRVFNVRVINAVHRRVKPCQAARDRPSRSLMTTLCFNQAQQHRAPKQGNEHQQSE
jgi:hypothetical protein